MSTYTNMRPAAELTSNLEIRYAGSSPDFVGMFERAKDYLTESHLPEIKGPYLGTTSGAIQIGPDLAHFAAGDLAGRARYAKTWMFHAMKHFNMATWRMPLTLDRRYDAPDGSYADFWLSDGELSTYRIAKGIDPIPQIGAIGPNGTGANTPHRTIIMMWSINGSPADFTEFHVVTAADISNGHTAPEGKNVCRVHARAGQTFTWRDNILYKPNGRGERWVDEDRSSDPDADPIVKFNSLVANVGQPASMEWMDVQSSRLKKLPSTFATPDIFFSRDVQIRSNANNLANSADMVHFECSFLLEGTGTRFENVFEIINDNCFRVMALRDGLFSLQAGDTEIRTPLPDYGVYSRFATLQFVVDARGGGDMAILDDDGVILVSAPTPVGHTFRGLLRFFGGPSTVFRPIHSYFTSALLRIGSLTRAGTVTHGFEGDASAPATDLSTGGVAITGLADLRMNNASSLLLTPGKL